MLERVHVFGDATQDKLDCQLHLHLLLRHEGHPARRTTIPAKIK